MSAFVRNLTFQTNNLGKQSTLLLTFNDLSESPGVGSREAVVWRVSTFGESGPYQMQVTYKNHGMQTLDVTVSFQLEVSRIYVVQALTPVLTVRPPHVHHVLSIRRSRDGTGERRVLQPECSTLLIFDLVQFIKLSTKAQEHIALTKAAIVRGMEGQGYCGDISTLEVD
ncbi:hypothetical protein BDR04DRAFT_1141249 [Suillus decipiens]|nr:hypothetical protein BDR04DRAFT_1141249 [Suillus decipiens]